MWEKEKDQEAVIILPNCHHQPQSEILISAGSHFEFCAAGCYITVEDFNSREC